MVQLSFETFILFSNMAAEGAWQRQGFKHDLQMELNGGILEKQSEGAH